MLTDAVDELDNRAILEFDRKRLPPETAGLLRSAAFAVIVQSWRARRKGISLLGVHLHRGLFRSIVIVTCTQLLLFFLKFSLNARL